MTVIKKGTTPSFICVFDPDTASVRDIQSAVFSVRNSGTVTHHLASDLLIDASANTVSYHFSQEETLAWDADTRVEMELHVLMNDNRTCVAENQAVVRASQYEEVLT